MDDIIVYNIHKYKHKNWLQLTILVTPQASTVTYLREESDPEADCLSHSLMTFVHIITHGQYQLTKAIRNNENT